MNAMKTLLYLAFILAIVGCSSESSSPAGSSLENSAADLGGNATVGLGGSLARFTISGDYLYIATPDRLYSFNLIKGDQPQLSSEISTTNFSETIFSMDGHLFLGTRNGVMIYSLADPSRPSFTSIFQHITSCDPVVAKGNTAFATLRVESECNRGRNSLDAIDITDINNPSSISTISMTNPNGLGISGNYLFVCDDDELIRFELQNGSTPVNKATAFNLQDCYDLIPVEDRLIVVSKEGVHQFQVNSAGELSLLSTIAVE